MALRSSTLSALTTDGPVRWPGARNFSASQFDDYTGILGGASRVPDASDSWVPNAFNGAGLDHERAADAPRGEFEAWNTRVLRTKSSSSEDERQRTGSDRIPPQRILP